MINLFRIHDIRGEYGSDVTPEKFVLLGSAANALDDAVLIGMDYRPYNRELFEAFCSGFQGEKTFIGNAPTPATAFLSEKIGLSITASHNPPSYAGAKFFKNRTIISEQDLRTLEKRFNEATAGEKKEASFNEERELLNIYVQALPPFEGGLFDLAGGAACILRKIFPASMFSYPDPQFKNHDPEPKDSTLSTLKEKTRGGPVGFAFDGDADRVIVCDSGIVLEGDVVAALIATSHLKKRDKVVLSIDCRQEVFDLLENEGFKTITTKVGDPNVLGTALRENAVFSAERSGHYAFLNHAPVSDGIYTAAILSSTKPGEALEFSKRFKNVTLIEQVFVKLDFSKLKELVQEKEPSQLVTLDGVKAVFDDYTILIRASTTEPKVRINCEAKNTEQARTGMELAKALVSKCLAI